MATDYEDKIRRAGKKRSESYNDAGNQAAASLTEAAGQFATDTEQANAAYLQGMNDAQKLYQQRMDEGYTQFADIITNSQREAQAELAQEEQEIANKQKAARWTGAAELASSVANLIGVGGFNAAHQQYKTYSQDWMRQADADMRAHRAKVGNLRERQRAMQQQLLQLRMNNAGQALQAAQRQAEAARKANEQSAAARRDAATAGVKVQFDAADRAAAAEYEGEVTAANMGQRQEQMAQQDRHFNAQMGQRNKEFAARMAAKGLKPDGTIDEKLLAQKQEIVRKYRDGGAAGEIEYPIIDANGDVNIAHMHPKQMEELMLDARSAIENDLGPQEAKEFLREFRSEGDDKGRNAVLKAWMGKSPRCGEIIRTIDASYRGYHGTPRTAQAQKPENKSGYSHPKDNNDQELGFDSNNY